MTYAEKLSQISRMRQELFELERSANCEAKSMQPLTEDQAREMQVMQARFDSAYTKAGRTCEPPHAYERPDTYRQRLIAGLQKYSPKYQGKNLTGITHEEALSGIEREICDDAARFGPTYGMRDGQIKQLTKSSGGGHIVHEFVGNGNTHFSQHFPSNAKKVVSMPSWDQAQQMTRDNLLSRLTERVPGWARTLVSAPRSTF
jgi:hypothetical protein